jgi:hypothetical protein
MADPVQGYYRAPASYVAFESPEVGRYRVRGWVDGFDRFNLTLRAAGREVPVRLHQGTIILPTGLTLQRGMFVSVDGYWNDYGFHADRIVLDR